MSMFTIAWKDIRIRLKDRKSFITLLLMPIVLTAILGSALSGAFSENGSLPELTEGVVVTSQDELTYQFLHDTLQGKELKESITLKNYKTESDLRKAIEDGKVDAGLVIPDGWKDGILNGETVPVKLFKDPGKDIQYTILSTITESFTNRVATVSAATRTMGQELSSAVPVSNQNIDLSAAMKDLSEKLSTIADSKENGVITQKDGKEPLSGMQYYAAAMGVMFILFNTTIGAKTILQERNTDTLARLMVSPIRHSSIMGGKFLGTLSFTILQFMVFVIATRLLFGVDWGSNGWQLFLLGLAYSVTVSGLAMLLAGFLTDEKTADSIGGIGVQVLALLGGSMIPLASFPDALQKFASIAPNKWALGGFLDIMNGTSWDSLVLPVTILVLSGLLALWIGSLKLKLR
ncbi:ABC transporter permease [Bacillus sp. es.034]|uniref:ABC transporter permease n=1 Tax=Bacillus sp. es.034 TaxID=1761763 RepID=UPI000BF8474F|nr:ABC transporter permease [Bacillus sp. es.034]PFG05158.1 ABC-2 type transport system permease protein [Bacillus sp. es.034]